VKQAKQAETMNSICFNI